MGLDSNLRQLTPAQWIDRIAATEPMTLQSVDLHLQNPESVRTELGRSLHVIGRVENEVGADPLYALMPRLGTEYRGYQSLGHEFLKLWIPQEHAHGEIINALERELGQVPASVKTGVDTHNRFAGILGKLSSSVHGVFEMIYLTRGAMHERATVLTYKSLHTKLTDLGELALAETMVRPIKPQEGRHFGYYHAAAQHLKDHLDSWQLWLARKISVATYAPVGAGNSKDKPNAGHVTLKLLGNSPEEFSEPIQNLADELLTEGQDHQLPKFVAKAIQRCVDLELST